MGVESILLYILSLRMRELKDDCFVEKNDCELRLR